MLIVGDASGITIPELPRARSSIERLYGARLLHTHLSYTPLSQEDLMDMLFLRLDSISVVTVNAQGEPEGFQYAYLLPPNPNKQVYSISEFMHWTSATIDLAKHAETLEKERSRIISTHNVVDSALRAVLVSVSTEPKDIQQKNIDELNDLAKTCGLTVTGTLIQRTSTTQTHVLLGKGKLAELEILALQGHASTIVFDGELTPAQLSYLSSITQRKIIDRTQLILDIFAQRANTSAGKLQVEMAQLKYLQTRLAKKGTNLDRLMGGVGGRGPGETKLEIDKRRIKDRIVKIKTDLASLRKQRALTRHNRSKANLPVVALVGYTNAGKSTTLNALTNSETFTENKLFATLDPATRRLRFPNEQEVVLADTVGFIRDLPKELFTAFQATLEELNAANVLVHIADASHEYVEQQIRSVEDILKNMGIDHITTLLALNKWDKVPQDKKRILRAMWPHALTIVATKKETLTKLSQRIYASISWTKKPYI